MTDLSNTIPTKQYICVYVYLYIYIYIHIHTYIYIYILPMLQQEKHNMLWTSEKHFNLYKFHKLEICYNIP